MAANTNPDPNAEYDYGQKSYSEVNRAVEAIAELLVARQILATDHPEEVAHAYAVSRMSTIYGDARRSLDRASRAHTRLLRAYVNVVSWYVNPINTPSDIAESAADIAREVTVLAGLARTAEAYAHIADVVAENRLN